LIAFAGQTWEVERTVDALAMEMIGLAGVLGSFHGEIRSD
jgi:hypothetical protein